MTLDCWMAWSGTLQVTLLTSRNATTFCSASKNRVTAPHMAVRSPCFLPISDTRLAFCEASSRNFPNDWHCAGGCAACGAPNPDPGGPAGNEDCCGDVGQG